MVCSWNGGLSLWLFSQAACSKVSNHGLTPPACVTVLK